MKISNNWLKDYIKTDLNSEKIATYLTDIGLEVEGVEIFESIKGSLEGILVGKVISCEKHPNADKLKKTKVDIGADTLLDIVCGAPNVAEGQIVPVAIVGTKIYTKDGSYFEIKKAKIRGEVSEGMICAEDELGLSDNHEGIMVLDETYEIGTPLAKYFDVSKDEVYEIGLTPNRTDAMSHYGVARDLNAFLSVANIAPTEFNKITSDTTLPEGHPEFQIEVEDTKLSPRYIGAVLENVKIKPSPKWLQDRLLAIGLSPINNVVDITNYVLHGLGQPLHAFDADKISGQKIIVGTVEPGTKFTTLDGVERSLNGTEIIIKDARQKPMCIAGVFGGIESGVSEQTTRIFLESAYFNPVAVRKAAKAHGLNTDASFRFERGVDINLTKTALQIAVKMLEDLAEAQLVGGVLEKYPEEVESHYIVFRYSKLDQILGVKIHRETVKKILKSLDIEILNEIIDGLEFSVPTYRADVTREIDVIEEILRIYGYNKVESPQKIAFTPVSIPLESQDTLENAWARLLQGNGFYEVMNNSLTNLKDTSNAVQLLNPLSGDLAFMRTSLLEGLLQNAVYNINRKNSDIKFFEFGKIYHKFEQYEERKQLALLVSGKHSSENWLIQKSTANFYHLKSYVRLLLEKLGLKIKEKPLVDVRFSDGIEFVVKGTTLARLGKVAPELLKSADMEQEAFFAEIEVETCQNLRKKEDFKFVEIPKFNKIRRDLALLVANDVSYADLHGAVLALQLPYLKNINLFDVYEGKNLPDGKKSYALSFELLNEEKTLEEKEISTVMNKIVSVLEKNFGANLRG